MARIPGPEELLGVQPARVGGASLPGPAQPVPDYAGPALDQGLADAAQVVGKIAAMKRESLYSEARAAGLTGLQELQTSLLSETDPGALGQKWQEGVARVREQAARPLGQDEQLSKAFAQDFNLAAARMDNAMFTRAMGLNRDRNRAALDKELAASLGSLTAAQDSGSVDLVRANGLESIRRSQEVGALTAEQAEAESVRFLGGIDEFTASRLIRQDPAGAKAALADPGQFKALDPLRRLKLQDQAEAQQEANLRQVERLAAQREREHRQAQEDNAQAAFLGIVSGKYNLADFKRDAQDRRFGLADSKALYRMLTEESATHSDIGVKLGIVDSMGQGRDQRDAILAAASSGELSGADAVSLLEKNRQIQRQEGPFATREYDEAKGLLSRVFGQGGDKWDMTRQDRYAAASDELMQAVLDPKGGGAAAAIPTARRIMARELERGIARPAGYVGEITARGLEEHRARLAREFAALPPEEQAKQAPRYNGQLAQIEQAINSLARIEDIRRTLSTRRDEQ